MSKIIGSLMASGASALGGYFFNQAMKTSGENPTKKILLVGASTIAAGLLIKKATGASLMNIALSFVGGVGLNYTDIMKKFFTPTPSDSQTQSKSA